MSQPGSLALISAEPVSFFAPFPASQGSTGFEGLVKFKGTLYLLPTWRGQDISSRQPSKFDKVPRRQDKLTTLQEGAVPDCKTEL